MRSCFGLLKIFEAAAGGLSGLAKDLKSPNLWETAGIRKKLRKFKVCLPHGERQQT